MIKELFIQNYLSHKRTSLKLHPGVNVFIGASDNGKSAIIKAINWCVNNKPVKEGYRSDWGGDTAVDLTLDNDVTISRERGSENLYIISTDKGVAPQDFKSFNQGVPDEVSEILNMSDLNFQFQADKHFLLSNSSGEVSRYLNKVASLDEIDRGLVNIAKMQRSANTELNSLTAKEQELEEEIATYSNLDELEKKYRYTKDLQGDIEGVHRFIQEITELLNAWRLLQDDEGKFPVNIDDIDRKYVKLNKDALELKLLKNAIDDLTELISSYDSTEEEIENYYFIYDAEEKYLKLRDSAKEIRKVEEDIQELSALVITLNSIINDYDNLDAEYDELKEEYDELMPEGSICPLCKQKIKKD